LRALSSATMTLPYPSPGSLDIIKSPDSLSRARVVRHLQENLFRRLGRDGLPGVMLVFVVPMAAMMSLVPMVVLLGLGAQGVLVPLVGDAGEVSALSGLKRDRCRRGEIRDNRP